MTADVGTQQRMFIGGEWVAAAETFPTIDPSTGERIAYVPAAGAGEVDRAVQAARGAFREWSRMNPRARGKLLAKAAAAVRKHAEPIAMLDAIDGGMPLKAARSDVTKGAEKLEYYG